MSAGTASVSSALSVVPAFRSPILPFRTPSPPQYNRLLDEGTDPAMDIDTLTGRIIGAAIEVHRELGPGLLESSYQACLSWELIQRGLDFERQKRLPRRPPPQLQRPLPPRWTPPVRISVLSVISVVDSRGLPSPRA